MSFELSKTGGVGLITCPASEIIEQIVKSDSVDYGILIANRHNIAWDIKSRDQLLMSSPNPRWIKSHPIIKVNNEQGQKVPLSYVPADKVEFVLDMLYPRKKISITGQGVSHNGVWVTVRVEYFDPIYNEWLHVDGIGALELQTEAGAAASNLMQIKSGALQKAFPAAKTYAIKDACDHLGNIFGRNINRNHTLGVAEVFRAEDYAKDKDRQGKQKFINEADSLDLLKTIEKHLGNDQELNDLYQIKLSELS